jgi:hypothetical protein
MARQVDGKFMSAFIRATKQVAAAGKKEAKSACCAPGCCS